MSDYVRTKAVRYKPTEKNLQKLGLKNEKEIWDLEDTMPDIFGYKVTRELQKAGKPYFSPNSGYNDNIQRCNYYIDYVLDYEYGVGGEYGKTRELYPEETEKYIKIFEPIVGEVAPENFRLVDFSYYNGCDAPDYFDESEDPFYKPV